MKIYWNWNSIPELKGCSKESRKAACRYAWKKSFWRWQGICILVIYSVISGLMIESCRDIWRARGLFFVVPGSAIGGGILGVLYGQIMTHFSRPYMREYFEKEKVLNRTEQGSGGEV